MFMRKREFWIVVTEERYDIYGTPGSKRNAFYAALVKNQGGINESVPPGVYTLSLTKGLTPAMSLEEWNSKI